MKKSRERFSIKFNLTDPDHKHVIEVLEKQGARNKAPYIVRAVLHYEAELQHTNEFAPLPVEQASHAASEVSPNAEQKAAHKQKNGPAPLFDDKMQAKVAKSLNGFFAQNKPTADSKTSP